MTNNVNMHLTWGRYFHEENRIEAKFVPSQEDYPVHDHEFMETVVVVGGSCWHRHVLGEERLGKGDAFLMRPGAWHTYRNCQNLALYVCCFDPGILGRELGWMIDDPLLGRLLWSIPLSPAQRGMAFVPVPGSQLPHCRKVLDQLCTLSEGNDAIYRADKVGLLGLLLGALARQLPGAATLSKPAKPHPAITAALKLIDDDPTRTWDIQSLAAHVHADPDYLARRFSKVAGLPPMAYLRRRRLELATTLLANSKHPVGEVGNLVGWPDANYFARIFHHEFGLSPSTYRSRFHQTRVDSERGEVAFYAPVRNPLNTSHHPPRPRKWSA